MEIEGVLNISQTLTKMDQFERLYTAAYGPLIKRFVYERLVANIIRTFDLKHVTKAPIIPRLSTDIGYLNMIGATYINRTILKFERRFLGNTTEFPFDKPGEVDIHNRKLIAMLLDLQTLNSFGEKVLFRKAVKLLHEEYVVFYVQYYKYKRQVNRKEVIDVEEAVDVGEVDDAIPKDPEAPRAMNASSFLSNGLGSSDSFPNSSSDKGKLSEAELQAANATSERKVYHKNLKHWCD